MRRVSAGKWGALGAVAWTYSEVGATGGVLPGGYHQVRRVAEVGRGTECFERAGAAIIGWRMHRGAGLRVAASAPTADVGVVALLGLGWGPLTVVAPCRVAYVVDAPTRRGFAYGTLPGHPESGEEAFVVELDASGVVRLRITAFSLPATALARAGGPVTRFVQRVVTDRYVRALRREVAAAPG